ncbi:helix-turn-helix domain-containing protein [Streptomyces sp. CL12]|uniref:helix-turn-helix domain-containing protein n=1 Tax=Streptomyces sp. CL12 TaxID=3391744 RepID=UPI003A804163
MTRHKTSVLAATSSQPETDRAEEEEKFEWPSDGRRPTPEQRAVAAGWLRERYDRGASIRVLAIATGLSYGATHRLLTRAGTTFRAPFSGKRRSS